MNSKVPTAQPCPDVVKNLAGLVLTTMAWRPQDTVTFRFRCYLVNRKVTLYELGANDRHTMEITLEVGSSLQGLQERLTAEIAKVTVNQLHARQGDIVVAVPLSNDTLAERTDMRRDVYGYDNISAKPDVEWEVAVSNKVTVVRNNEPHPPVSYDYNLAFIDYKSQDLDAVRAAHKRDNRFGNYQSLLLKTGNSFHGYAALDYGAPDDIVNTLALSVLYQKDVIDLNWAMLCLLRKEAFLRVTQNFKGPIEFVERIGEFQFRERPVYQKFVPSETAEVTL